jgi:hypothetical protein
MHIFILLLASVLGLLMPEMAWADDLLKPIRGGNTWDLYVFGNGRVIYDILNSIKMLMVPTAGSTGFNTLLLCMASLGFLCLAIAAGFDPGKNLMRMFTYILVVWGVSWGSTSLTANVNVNDLVVNDVGLKENYVVDGVPALVALPAALTSQVGYYFTRVMETYFSMPDGFKTSSAGGQFNLFAKMVQEGNEFQFTDPKAKQTMQAYIGDCVVPAIAMGTFHGNVKNPLTGATEDAYGATVLAQSNNLMAALATASNQALMTKVYASNATIATATSSGVPAGGGSEAMGTLLTCDNAYKVMKLQTETNAAQLAAASSAAYAKAGVMVPYETLYSSMLASTSAPTGTTSRASGYILQQGMLNTMNGSFRQAAMQTGNNELMTAASIAQAEQSQRSTWVSGFHVFNNMMGYVFTVLQAFIFAITPMVVVALMVPGLGKSIFTNYAQILIWLTLWMPMLALINYIITLFGTESVSTALRMSDGVSLSNKGEISMRTTNLVIAAQFLGTMTPLITWGLVKGAMAFTEFISSGVGSAFASQAGATAASGNLSLNNMSMDNTSMNKFNTAMSSTVGTQATNAFTNAGALLTSHDGAGSSTSLSGSQVSAQKQMSSALSQGISESQAVSSSLSASKSSASSVEDAFRQNASKGHSKAQETAAQEIYQAAVSAADGKGSGATMNEEERASLQRSISAMEKYAQENGFSLKGGLSTPIGGANLDHKNTDSLSNDSGSGAQTAKGAGRVKSVEEDKKSLTNSAGNGKTGTTGTREGTTWSDDKSASHGQSAVAQKVLGDALSKQEAVTKQLSETKNMVDSFGVSSDTDMQSVNQRIAEMQGMATTMGASVAQIEAKGEALRSALAGRESSYQQEFDGTRGQAQAQMGALGSGAPDVQSQFGAIQQQSNAAVAAVDKGIADDTKRTTAVVEGREQDTAGQIEKGSFKKGDNWANIDARNVDGTYQGGSAADNANPSSWAPSDTPRHPRSR